ncbi:MAG TPA: ribbon-helix-helix domain-containing protein [Gemmatimonadales bacterium]|nr:ribbon-helix-helix domain-containing protein [Gemmatimonadales bacterium]
MGSLPERVLVGVRLPVPLARQLKVRAAEQDTTIQALIEEAVRAFLQRRTKER